MKYLQKAFGYIHQDSYEKTGAKFNSVQVNGDIKSNDFTNEKFNQRWISLAWMLKRSANYFCFAWKAHKSFIILIKLIKTFNLFSNKINAFFKRN